MTLIKIPKMDCPSEERLIRLRLDSIPEIRDVKFDLAQRSLTVIHGGSESELVKALAPLNFRAEIVSSVSSESTGEVISNFDVKAEHRVLIQLLAINGIMFFFELGLGLYADSTGLIADSLDMLADAAVYGMSLYAVGKSARLKTRAARVSGYLQIGLAVFTLIEVCRRFVYGSEPVGQIMMAVSFLALIANVSCMALLSKHREGAVHMKASWIFSTNDVIANIGVIVAGGLVYLFASSWPDLIIGTIITLVVFKGALTILRISET